MRLKMEKGKECWEIRSMTPIHTGQLPLIGVFMDEAVAKMLVDLWNQFEAKTTVNFDGHKGVRQALNEHLAGVEDAVEVSLTTTYVRGKIFHTLHVKTQKDAPENTDYVHAEEVRIRTPKWRAFMREAYPNGYNDKLDPRFMVICNCGKTKTTTVATCGSCGERITI